MPTPEIRLGPAAEAALLDQRLAGASTDEVLRTAITEAFPGQIALVSAFGAESAVLLHLVARIDPATPVIFIDTGRHFAETPAYGRDLAARLGLRDVRIIGPTEDEIHRHDPRLDRARRDPDACCAFRKVVPLERALEPFRAWITGRKRYQAVTRAEVKLFEAERRWIKVSPLAAWSADAIEAYRLVHGLPAHPLVAEGFASIGCAPCTTKVEAGEDSRAGRWRGQEKTECGIHRPRPRPFYGRNGGETAGA